MFDFRGKMFQLVELLIPSTITSNNQNTYFQQQPQLQSFNIPNQKVFIKAIETYSNNALTTSPITTASPIAAPADIQNGVLTMVENNTDNKKQIPLARLNNIWPVAGSNVPPYQPICQFKNFWTVDWTKCYVTTCQVPSGAFSYIFGVWYDYEPEYEDVRLMRELEELQIAELQKRNLILQNQALVAAAQANITY